LILDSLSRDGVEKNLKWLEKQHGPLLEFERGDIRDFALVKKLVRYASHVFHFAAQVAVTTSLDDPITDFEVNARGTLNILEAIRAQDTPPPLVLTSTNKVYGDLVDVKIIANSDRYEPEDNYLCEHGFSEERAVDFHSPYG